MAKKTITRYRDSKTGKFVSKKTWQRSRVHGGKRYRRQSVELPAARRKPKAPKMRPRTLPKPKPKEIEREVEREEEEIEYEGAFDSP